MVKWNILVLAVAILSIAGMASAGTLDQIKNHGMLIGGSPPRFAGFGLQNEKE
jgi:hypothetical protein